MGSGYVRCYDCHVRRRRGGWHDPERIEGLAARDAALGRSAFYVYVLETHYGHYVGHTAHVRGRLRAHREGEVPSTAHGDPKLIWQSGPLSTRTEAAQFEAALKSLRDQSEERFCEITGVEPIPFERVFTEGRSAPGRGKKKRSALGCGCKLVILAAIAAALLMLIAAS